jgi:broad-specificity NMP kinase
MKISSKSLEARGFNPKKKAEEPKKETPQVIEKEVIKESPPIIVPMESPTLDRIEDVLVQLKKSLDVKSLEKKGKPKSMDMKVNRDKYGMIESATVTFNY